VARGYLARCWGRELLSTMKSLEMNTTVGALESGLQAAKSVE